MYFSCNICEAALCDYSNGEENSKNLTSKYKSMKPSFPEEIKYTKKISMQNYFKNICAPIVTSIYRFYEVFIFVKSVSSKLG